MAIPNLCKSCLRKPFCTELCAPAEQYANQDVVGWDNITITTNEHLDILAFKNSDMGAFVTLSIDFLIAKEYYVNKRTIREVADICEVSRMKVWRTINRLEKLINKKVGQDTL